MGRSTSISEAARAHVWMDMGPNGRGGGPCDGCPGGCQHIAVRVFKKICRHPPGHHPFVAGELIAPVSSSRSSPRPDDFR
ncbi:hypothetical protein [uncultured Sphaerochaeta sp.]|uniref:hypothetical protein n=1 Tax=uncultured Sphaerochaeta sp. TaxID=886478 RepID=UPI0026112A5C|nr:hypothetical protein [uncultured Sphaerochaeta sp.]